MRWKRFVALLGEVVYLLFFFSGNFAIIFPGEPMALSFKFVMVVIPLVNFALMLFIVRKDILTKRQRMILFCMSAAFSAVFLKAGYDSFSKFLLYRSFRDTEGMIVFLLCIEEISLRAICL